MRNIIIFTTLICSFYAMGFTTPPHANIYEYGLYKKISDGAPVELEGTDNEFIKTGEVLLVERTRVIPAKLENYFGFRYELVGLPPGKTIKFDIVLNHPPIKKPDGSISTKSYYWQELEVHPSGTYKNSEHFGFNQDYELVPGKWTFRYYLGDRVLLEEDFTIIDINLAK